MATIIESPFMSYRLRQIEERYEEPTSFGRCDCTSYSYMGLSVSLFTIGTAITILALSDAAHGQVFSHLGHMWLIGPIFICSGLMVAVKCILYLRRKSVVQIIIHQRLFRHLHELAGAQRVRGSGCCTPAPPPYDSISQGQGPSELPPPTYAEAVALLHETEILGKQLSLKEASEHY